MVAFTAAGHHSPLSGTKLYHLVPWDGLEYKLCPLKLTMIDDDKDDDEVMQSFPSVDFTSFDIVYILRLLLLSVPVQSIAC